MHPFCHARRENGHVPTMEIDVGMLGGAMERESSTCASVSDEDNVHPVKASALN
jgi:hypothetical protein